jgi:hypothetical protein
MTNEQSTMNNEGASKVPASSVFVIRPPSLIIGHLPFVICHLFLMLGHIHEMCPTQALARKMPNAHLR